MRHSLFACAIAVAVSGCVSRTGGQLGHASFSWEECLLGCSTADHAMAAGGARATVSVALNAGYSFAGVRSTNPSVASFTIGGGFGGTSVDVLSGSPGSATLQLLDGNGGIVDQTVINVVATAKLAVTRGWSGPAPLVLASTPQVFHVTTTDASGKTTIGTGSVHFTLSGPLTQIATLIAEGDSITFMGTPGQGAATATTPNGITATLPVTVVPPAAITRLDATVLPNSTSGTNVYAHVKIVANSASGPVYGASCNWQIGNSSVMPYQQSVNSLESAPSTDAQLLLLQPGKYSATCTVGAASATVQVSR